MKTLIIKNISTEGPGTIEDFLAEREMPYHIADLSAGDALPPLDEITHMVVMGGPMAVYEMDKTPYLKTETDYLKNAIDKNKKVLGICLGAQLLARALGARVYPGGTTVLGWHDIQLTPAGTADPALGALTASENSNTARVFQWHGDTFDIPAGAIRTAFSRLYPNQAFSFEDRIHALQFHIEVTPSMLEQWFSDEPGIDLDAMLKDTEAIFPQYLKRAHAFYKAFFS